MTNVEMLEYLDKISQRLYQKNYEDLCNDRKRTVETLYKTGDF